MLADRDIRTARKNGFLDIEPWDETALQPASYDVTLDRHFLVPNAEVTELDMAKVKAGHMLPPMTASNDGFVLEPGDFVLGSTRETVRIGRMHVGRVEGKSCTPRRASSTPASRAR
jgi:dCTP deaminase